MTVTVTFGLCPTCEMAYQDTTPRWVVCDSRGADRGCYDDEVDALNYALLVTEFGW